jgi:endonuclease/exonuclease/phosphatase family metal-dependent hydrolase
VVVSSVIESHTGMKNSRQRPSLRESLPIVFQAVVLACTLGCATDQGAKPVDPPPSAPTTVSVVSLNLRYDNAGDGVNAWPNRELAVIEALRSFDADVIGLQEALPHQADAVRSGLHGYAMLIRTREADSSRGEATPILWRADRWELDPIQHGTFWLSETPEVSGSKSWDSSLPRIATFARLIPVHGEDGDDGRSPLWIYNTHFDHRGPDARRESAKLLRARIEQHADRSEPVVLMGDLNAVPDSSPIRELLLVAESTRVPLIDCWAMRNPDEPKNATWNGFEVIEIGRRIDFVFASNLEVQEAVIERPLVAGRPISDHWPVRVVFGLQPGGSAPR